MQSATTARTASGRAIEFWFDFASTYSYLTAVRIEKVAHGSGLQVVWKPFLLGPIFASQGWTSSPFSLYPAKGRYMVRDLERIAGARGLAFRMPDPFPQHSLVAARLALAGLEHDWGTALCQAIFRAEFAEGCNISEPAALHHCLDTIQVPRAPVMERAASDAIKSLLRSNTQDAQTHGIFGAPTLRTADGELFWGDDRLDQAVAWGQQL
jgi:2-hydroxychromene-2-carboxylate isomerase